MPKIAIYSGAGVSPEACGQLLSALSSLSTYTVKRVSSSFFLSSGWEGETALVVFPGGRDLPYHEALQGAGNARIRSYVEHGGRFLGLCAGGYYGASCIEFEKGGELEVCGSRELAFFPGKAVGPAYGKGFFRYESEKGARAAPIAWEGGVSTLYFNGGCLFEGEHPSVEVVGRYNDLPGRPAAAVFCPFGKGAALLSGVHPEYSPQDPFWSYLIHKILI